MSNPKYSIVIPVYNEEELLEVLFTRLKTSLEDLDDSWEVILINDGSKDKSLTMLKEFHKRDSRFKVLSFSRNFGHQTAITAGINFARGDAVIIMDADLQDPPEILGKFIDKWKEGYEVVYAVRKKRKESAFKKLAYLSFYRLLRSVSDIDIPLDTGDFCIMDRKIVKILNRLPERNRFVRGIRSWSGYRQIGMEYERDKRLAGEPKYTMKKLFKLAFDGLISFSKLPLRIASVMGVAVSALSFLYGIGTFFQKVFTQTTVPGYATTIILITFLGGIQLITIGIIGEYLGRVYDEVKNRPLYILSDVIGFDTEAPAVESPENTVKEEI